MSAASIVQLVGLTADVLIRLLHEADRQGHGAEARAVADERWRSGVARKERLEQRATQPGWPGIDPGD